MKHLLHIPTGTYISFRFNSINDSLSLEEYSKISGYSYKNIINHILSIDFYIKDFYTRNNLPLILLEEEFEIVEI